VEVPKILGDIFESIAGAIFVDSGFSLDVTWSVFYRLLKPQIGILIFFITMVNQCLFQ